MSSLKSKRIFTALGLLIYIVILIRNLWIGDDAFITLRVVDNWINGYGMTWNTGERVQVFTHPLWFFFVAAFYMIKADPYFTFYLSAIFISTVTVAFLLHHFSPSFQTTLLGSWLIISSMAFMDFSSSGLENPLSHFLLLLFVYIYFDVPEKSDIKRLFWISFSAGLAALTRLDTLLFYLPVLLFEWYQLRKHWLKASLTILGGFLPLIFWEGFSLIYYGFPFPNTLLAKTNTTIPRIFFIQHGIYYLFNSLKWDPVTLITFAIAAFITIAENDKRKKLLLMGGCTYILYVIWIGGDFMTGRFFSILFLLSILLLLKSNIHQHFHLDNAFSLGLAFLVVFMLGLTANDPPMIIQVDDHQTQMANGIINEKLFYFPESSWLIQRGRYEVPNFGEGGLDAREAGNSPITGSGIGAFGYYAGPKIYIIDSAALTDPLLARIPYTEFDRIGHYTRSLFDGYVETCTSDFENQIHNPSLKTYYDKLSIIIHDELFTLERWRLIVELNTGYYNYLIEDYSSTLSG